MGWSYGREVPDDPYEGLGADGRQWEREESAAARRAVQDVGVHPDDCMCGCRHDPADRDRRR